MSLWPQVRLGADKFGVGDGKTGTRVLEEIGTGVLAIVEPCREGHKLCTVVEISLWWNNHYIDLVHVHVGMLTC